MKTKILGIFVCTILIVTASLQVMGTLESVGKDNRNIYLTSANTWLVDNKGCGDYICIQDAIDNATAGDTIIVINGPYYENVVANKTLNITGISKPIIDAEGNGDVVLVLVDWLNISGFTIKNSGSGKDDCGIEILSNYVTIFGNTISDNEWGIRLNYSINNIISDNIISNNNNGMCLKNSSNLTISNNAIGSNNLFGMFLSFCCDFSTISDNTISNNKYGMYHRESSDNIISGNTISLNYDYGIRFQNSNNNTVCDNTISNNKYGIRTVYLSNDNIFYHNNFIDNAESNVEDNQTNIWDNDYPSGGNYWDDYTGIDGNGDGIGDVPYSIPGGSNQDRYPFINQNGWISPPPEPDLDCDGSLSWTDVKPSNTVTGSFTVENVGDPDSLLAWEIEEYPDWGTWNFSLKQGGNLTPEGGPVTIQVSIAAPNEQEKTFGGEIKSLTKMTVAISVQYMYLLRHRKTKQSTHHSS